MTRWLDNVPEPPPKNGKEAAVGCLIALVAVGALVLGITLLYLALFTLVF